MKKHLQALLIGLVLIAGMAGCAQVEETPPPTETTTPLVETETATATVQPTDTSQPPLVILLAPAQGWGEDHTAVEQAAVSRGLLFEVRQEMTLGDAPQNLRTVVSFGNNPGLEELISGLPQVQFLVVGGEA